MLVHRSVGWLAGLGCRTAVVFVLRSQAQPHHSQLEVLNRPQLRQRRHEELRQVVVDLVLRKCSAVISRQEVASELQHQVNF